MKYDYLTMENLPDKPQYLSPGSKRLEPVSKYYDLIGTMSAFNCLYLGHYSQIELKFLLLAAISKCFFRI